MKVRDVAKLLGLDEAAVETAGKAITKAVAATGTIAAAGLKWLFADGNPIGQRIIALSNEQDVSLQEAIQLYIAEEKRDFEGYKRIEARYLEPLYRARNGFGVEESEKMACAQAAQQQGRQDGARKRSEQYDKVGKVYEDLFSKVPAKIKGDRRYKWIAEQAKPILADLKLDARPEVNGPAVKQMLIRRKKRSLRKK